MLRMQRIDKTENRRVRAGVANKSDDIREVRRRKLDALTPKRENA